MPASCSVFPAGRKAAHSSLSGHRRQIRCRRRLLIGGYKESAEWNSADVNSLDIGIRDDCIRHVEKGQSTIHPESRSLASYPFGHAEGFPDAFKQCFREVYQSIEDKNGTYHYATFEDGLHEMVLCEKIFESNEKQQWIKVQ